MNEAEKKIVEQYLEMMENNNASPLMAAMPEVKSWHQALIDTPEYDALKALVEDKPDADVCKNKDRHVGSAVGVGTYAACKDCGDAWTRVEEPKKPKKQTYKLSEMWKVWYTSQFDSAIKGTHINTCLFLSLKDAQDYSIPFMTPIAITRADATEFCEGEGLNVKT